MLYYLFENIRFFCRRKGITLQDLATLCGVSYNSIKSQGTGNPSLKSLQRISDALGVDVWELLRPFPELHQDERKPAENTLICPNCGKAIQLHPETLETSSEGKENTPKI